jgi:hypothetical protein
VLFTHYMYLSRTVYGHGGRAQGSAEQERVVADRARDLPGKVPPAPQELRTDRLLSTQEERQGLRQV